MGAVCFCLSSWIEDSMFLYIDFASSSLYITLIDADLHLRLFSFAVECMGKKVWWW